MRCSGWTLYGRPVEKKNIGRVLREWSNKHPEFESVRAPLPRKPEKLEPFTMVQREKFLMGYEADSIANAEDEFWDSIYGRLDRLFPVAEREKIDPADSPDWDDERTLTEAIKGGYIHAYDFAKDVRRFILTETGVRFYKEE